MTEKKDKTAARVAALERELAELKGALAGKEDKAEPKEPFKPEPYQRYDPTANMRMPDSALRAMVNAVPDNFMRDVVRDNRAPQNPGMISDGQQSASPRPGAGDGNGWAREIPLGPSLHARYVDAQLDAADARDKAERIRQDAQLRATEKMTEQIETMRQQTEALAKLAEPRK